MQERVVIDLFKPTTHADRLSLWRDLRDTLSGKRRPILAYLRRTGKRFTVASEGEDLPDDLA